MHEKRRLELIVERMALTRACNVLEGAKLTGYTVVDAMAGFGGQQHWRREGDLSTAQDMVVVISIGDAEKIDNALRDLYRLLDRHVGVLSVSVVQVMRPELF